MTALTFEIPSELLVVLGKEHSEQWVTLIAEYERCDERGIRYEETPAPAADNSFRCAHE